MGADAASSTRPWRSSLRTACRKRSRQASASAARAISSNSLQPLGALMPCSAKFRRTCDQLSRRTANSWRIGRCRMRSTASSGMSASTSIPYSRNATALQAHSSEWNAVLRRANPHLFQPGQHLPIGEYTPCPLTRLFVALVARRECLGAFRGVQRPAYRPRDRNQRQADGTRPPRAFLDSPAVSFPPPDSAQEQPGDHRARRAARPPIARRLHSRLAL